MLEYIRNELLGMTDKGEYAAFTSSLIPGCDNIIGIRQPVLKQYAKQLIKENKDFRQLLSEPDIYQEETLLRSYIIGMGTAKEKDFKKALKDFNTFVPLVNNWAVNDSFCVEFRVMDMFRDEFLPYIKECIESFDEYRARGAPINAGYMVLNPEIFDYIEGDNTVFEKDPLEKLAKEGQLMSYMHNGFWQCMDNKREMDMLEKYLSTGTAPWKKW